ncbi:hypothetical protein BaRGS_00011680 [Batillaria attramentaria]|uniref:Uncharacterized protein n=1 Tax=Batillaria attramentaria TaxID=370345 RepID=A0ABD0LCN2_9CAEN
MSSSQSIYPSVGGSRPYEVIPSVRYSSADDSSTCEIVAASDTLPSLPSDRNQLKEMAEANKRLRCRSKRLLGILIAMVALLVVTGIPVYMKMEPWIKTVLRDIFGQGPASEAQPISGLSACGHGGGGSIGECAKVINQEQRSSLSTRLCALARKLPQKREGLFSEFQDFTDASICLEVIDARWLSPPEFPVFAKL